MSGSPDKLEHDEEPLAEGTLVSHLLELRSRIMKALGAVLLVFVCLVPFAQEIFEFVSKPLVAEAGAMISIHPATPFLTPFKTTFYVAVFVAMPVVLYQVWQFVAPGLYRREKRFALPLIASSIALFYAGVAFAYFVVFRLMFAFFTKVAPANVDVAPDIAAYLDFVISIFLAFGLAFETPIATVMLIWSGLVSITALRNARRYVFLGCFIFGMLLTPPDLFSQTLLAIPMYCLYEAGLVLARVLLPEKTAAGEEAGT
jgi:sec-independent protein translocase protein TatC